MKGDPKVIDYLNKGLRSELTAINQYWLHFRLLDNWGLKEMSKVWRKESIEEMQHAQEVIERILYLEGLPNLQKYMKINVGQSVPEQFEFDLQLEYGAVERLNKGIEAARAAGDNGTRALLEKILVDEEEHVDWLETQLGLIKQVGIENYLQSQMS